jgi:AraC family transcriptional regulator of adaptative response/methylated-DNA-[protein]-cysteine methyltransferase
MSQLPPIKEMQAAYLHRKAAYDGLFFLGVRTTGIFCRPTCPARKPLPKNVEYFRTQQEALRSGYRPCLRCRPMDIDSQPRWVAELLQEVERDPATRITEWQLQKRGIDPGTARRHFLKHYGMTFQAYARSRRLAAALQQIRAGKSTTAVAMETGYESESGFRAAFARTFAAVPSNGRHQDCVFLSWMPSPLGPLVAGATSQGVCLLEFSDRRLLETQIQSVRKCFQVPVVPGDNHHLKQLMIELTGYFSGQVKRFSVPLIYPGTEFQMKVWKALLTIPYGETRSYDDIANSVGVPNACRAVGTANGKNRIAIVIPCHRVINKSGQLGGYGGGLRRKQYLLDLERSHG